MGFPETRGRLAQLWDNMMENNNARNLDRDVTTGPWVSVWIESLQKAEEKQAKHIQKSYDESHGWKYLQNSWAEILFSKPKAHGKKHQGLQHSRVQVSKFPAADGPWD